MTPPAPQRPIGSEFSAQSIIPLVLFLVVHRVAGLRWAVVIATIWSVKTIFDRKRRGLSLGRFVPIVTGAVLLRGAIGAITGSETVYFGLGIATKYLVAAALLGSVVVGKALASYGAPYVMALPNGMAEHRLFASTMAIVTAIGGIYYAISATFDIWLFRRSSVEGFVLLRFLANWPLSTLAIILALGIAQYRLKQIPDIPPLAELVEQRLGAQFSAQTGLQLPPTETTTNDQESAE